MKHRCKFKTESDSHHFFYKAVRHHFLFHRINIEGINTAWYNEQGDDMKKIVVWDWNGTLLNDVDLCIETINQLLESEGLPAFPDKETYQKIFQFPIIEYYQNAGFDFNKTSFEELAQRYMAYYQPRSLSCPLHPGVLQVLQMLHKQGIKQYLLSASKLDLLYEQVNQYPIVHYFEEIFALDNIHAYSKKELARQCVKSHEWHYEDVIFVGDSVHDYEVASYAGCESILVDFGHEHKEKLLSCESRVVHTIQEAGRWILSDIA